MLGHLSRLEIYMKRLKNYILMAAGFAVLVTVVGVFAAGPAIAQAVRAALVSNVDEPGRIPFRAEMTFDGDCRFGCAGHLQGGLQVPHGKRLVITNVTGEVRSSVSGKMQVGNGLGSATIPTIFLGQMSPNFYSYGFDQQVLLFYDAGETPSLRFTSFTDDVSDGYVDMSGYLLDCTTATCAAIAGGL
jgi:hypothetical protein